MKVALVSTFPPQQCGIATYTFKLCCGLTDAAGKQCEFSILSEQGGATGSSGLECDSCFLRGTSLAKGIVEGAKKQGVHVAHFQHAPDIFGMGKELLGALRGLRANRIGTVVTLHTVFTRKSGLVERKPFAVSFHKKLGELCDAIIVHTSGSKRILLRHGVDADKVHVIAHGTDLSEPGDPVVGRRVLRSSEGERIMLFFGFVHMQKNIHVLIKAMPTVLEQVPESRLVVAGKVAGGTWYNRLYLSYLRRLIRKRGLEEKIRIVDNFIPDENVADIHAASEMVLLPHNQGYASASGVVHGAMAMRMPMLCSKSPKFEEVADEIDPNLLISTTSPREWAGMMIRLLEDREYHAAISEKASRYAEATFWKEVGKPHIEIYRKVLAQ